MQLRPKFSRTLFVVFDDDDTIHVPDHRERMVLEAKGIIVGHVYNAACGVSGEAAVYVSDEYDLDDDWCPECAKRVREDRDLIAMLKATPLEDVLGGRKFPVPVHVVRTPLSKSRDLI